MTSPAAAIRIVEEQARARLAELERFRTALDAVGDAIVLVDRTTMRIVDVNATACTMLGYTREEMLELPPPRLTADTLEQLENLYDDLITGKSASQSTEMRVWRRDGSPLPVEVHRHVQRSGENWIIVCVLRDVTERNEARTRLHHLAHYDHLTGLPNRKLFYETLGKTLTLASSSGWLVTVLCIDLDNFKTVNDTLGHATGDELLRQVSDRLVQCVRIRDMVGRLGGDEFSLILIMQDGQTVTAQVATERRDLARTPFDVTGDEVAVTASIGVTVHQGAALVANKIQRVLRAPFDLKGEDVSITVSIGIAVYPDDAANPEALLKCADAAMYRGKQAGRNTFRYFTAKMNAEAQARRDLETALRTAVENEEFALHYQPKVQLASGRIVGVEALLRWERPGHGFVSPRDFIPILEDTGLIVRVGTWVIARACRQIGQWQHAAMGPVQVSVNVSGRQFVEGDLDGDVIRMLGDNEIAASLLELELTESALMANTERTESILRNLKKRGVQIVVDDFGAGLSSLGHLRRFPITSLKIDIPFIHGVTSNPDDAAIVRAIIQMAHSLKLDVVAEGVETASQLAYLRQQRCDFIQGNYFSLPLPVQEVERLLRAEKRLMLPDGEPQSPMAGDGRLEQRGIEGVRPSARLLAG
jgi:diguanylate cyclase (GGDEF)-like protein/PAS domain S-box-containing protein